MQHPDADDYLTVFAPYARDFGDVYQDPEDERYRLLFERVCHLLVQVSTFNLAMPQEFRQSAALYLQGDPKTLAHLRQPEMRHFMLSDLYDYVHLSRALGRNV